MKPIYKHLAARWVLRGLAYHARGNLGTLAGVVVAVAVLVGALVVGDCVRGSLRDVARARLGRVDFAMAARERFFKSDLAGRLQDEKTHCAAALQTVGTVASDNGTARVNHTQIFGVSPDFWALADQPSSVPASTTNRILVNNALARRLGVASGDSVVVRVPRAVFLAADDMLAPREDVSLSMRLTIGGIVPDAGLGRFSLEANQSAPLTVFLPLGLLQEKLGLAGKANLLLVSAPSGDVAGLSERLRGVVVPADMGLATRGCYGGCELVGDRVFLEPAVVEGVLKLFPKARPISTYFVNEFRHGTNATPYSMLTAIGAPLVPPDFKTNEVLVNAWLAEDLGVSAGDSMEVSHFVMNAARRLEVKHSTLTIRGILPLVGEAADRWLMPDFPGLANAEKTENWDAGFPLDMRRIRPKDEQYWKEHRGTPKAFVSIECGRQLWGRADGFETAVRFDATAPNDVERVLAGRLDPAALGLVFMPVRALAEKAAGQAEDFGGLFIGFSFFLIVAALILLGLLFQFGMEKRASEAGVLLAVGLPPGRVRMLLALEGLGIAVLGGVLGAVGGVGYARAILHGLSTIWSGAVAESELSFHMTIETLAAGAVGGILVCAAVMAVSLKNLTRRPARELLDQGGELETSAPGGRLWAGWIALVAGLGGAGYVGVAVARGDTANVEAFFGGGAMLLIAGIAAVAVWLRPRAGLNAPLNWLGFAVRQCTRRRRRSLAVVSLLAAGSFLIVAINANKLDATRDVEARGSGTGGFALVAESTLPVVQDLNTKAGLEFFGLDAMPGVSFVPMRVRAGDEASCLNLNHAQAPRLLGVDPEALQSRKAFTFVKTLIDTKEPWLLLRSGGTGPVPVIADDASATWALGLKVGEVMNLTDERGRGFQVRLVGTVANSILQGGLLMEERAFIERFPGEGGHRFFLVDAPATAAGGVAAALTRGLEDRGLEVQTASKRLASFNAVQNTYLNTFQVLGGLGLLLGSAGLGAVVLRNLLERRREWAILRATGFTRGTLTGLAVLEHGLLLTIGLALGVGTALIAVLPVMCSPSARPDWAWIAALLFLVFTSGFLWIWLAARAVLSGGTLEALRGE
jgi:ABC-type lipoprotein release transport system permease subunit